MATATRKGERVLSIRMQVQDVMSPALRAVQGSLRTLQRVATAAVRAITLPFRLLGGVIRHLLSPIGLLQSAIGFFAARGMVRFLTGVAEAGDRVDKLALRLGVSTRTLQEFGHVAKISGVAVESIGRAFEEVSRRVSDAAQGRGSAVDALREIGLAAEELRRLAPEDQFERIVDALRRVEHQGDRSRLAAALFGRTLGGEMLQLVNSSSASVAELRREVHELGGVMDETAIHRSAAFQDALARMGVAFQGLRQRIATAFMPLWTESMERIAFWLAHNRDRVKEWSEITAAAFRMVSDSARAFGELLLQSIRDPHGSFAALGEVFQAMGRMIVDVFRETALEGLQIVGGVIRSASRPLIAAASELGTMMGRAIWQGIKAPFTKSLPELEEELESVLREIGRVGRMTPVDALDERRMQAHEDRLVARARDLRDRIEQVRREMEAPAVAMADRLATEFSRVSREIQSDWSNIGEAVERWQGTTAAAWEQFRQTLASVQNENVAEFLASLDEAKERFDAAVEAARRIAPEVKEAAEAAKEFADAMPSPEVLERSARLIEQANIMGLRGRARAAAEIRASYQRELEDLEEMLAAQEITVEAYHTWRIAAEQEMADRLRQINGSFTEGFLESARDMWDRMSNLYALGAEALNRVMSTIGSGFDRIFDGMVDGTLRIRDAFRDMARDVLKDIARILARLAAVQIVGGIFPGAALAKGGVFSKGQLQAFAKGGVLAAGMAGAVTPFASGGVVNQPTIFPMRTGMGLMGEAGPEAIMPLKRGRDGRLGVEAQGGETITVAPSVHIHTTHPRDFAAYMGTPEGKRVIVNAVAEGVDRSRQFRDKIRTNP